MGGENQDCTRSTLWRGTEIECMRIGRAGILSGIDLKSNPYTTNMFSGQISLVK